MLLILASVESFGNSGNNTGVFNKYINSSQCTTPKSLKVPENANEYERALGNENLKM